MISQFRRRRLIALLLLSAALLQSCLSVPPRDGEETETGETVSVPDNDPEPAGTEETEPSAETSATERRAGDPVIDKTTVTPGKQTNSEQTQTPETTAPENAEPAEETTADPRTLTPEYQAYAAEFAEKNKKCGWMDAEPARKLFNNAVEAWSWFYLTTAPVYGPYVDDMCHQRVDLPGITTYEGLRKYLLNFFTAEIADKIMSVRSDYEDIDGVLCAIQAARGSDIHYGEITNYYFHWTSFSTAEFTVTVQHFDDNLQPDGDESFTFNLAMDSYTIWHFTTFPMWL